LILRLAIHARTNQFGIIETPYARVKNGVVTDDSEIGKFIEVVNAHNGDLRIKTPTKQLRECEDGTYLAISDQSIYRIKIDNHSKGEK